MNRPFRRFRTFAPATLRGGFFVRDRNSDAI